MVSDGIVKKLTRSESLVPWPRLQSVLADRGLDALVATSHVNVTYLSDFWSMSQWSRRSAQVHAVAGVTPERDVDVVVPAGNADLVYVEGRVPPRRVWVYGSFVVRGLERVADGQREAIAFRDALMQESVPTPIEALAKALERRGLGASKIAVEYAGFVDGALAELSRRLPRASLVSGEEVLRKLREVKSPREIEILRTAARNSDQAFAAAASHACEGMAEREVESLLFSELVRLGSSPFLSSLTAGARTALPNGQAGSYELQPGDLLRFDGGGRYQLYTSDIARMGIVGRPTERQGRYYAAMREGLEAAIAATRPGVACSAVFAAAIRAVRANRIPDYERTHVGHGIGIENYDGPQFAESNDQLLEPGMVICLETPYYELGWGGVQAEDTLVVTDNGAERFTTQPAELVPVGI